MDKHATSERQPKDPKTVALPFMLARWEFVMSIGMMRHCDIRVLDGDVILSQPISDLAIRPYTLIRFEHPA